MCGGGVSGGGGVCKVGASFCACVCIGGGVRGVGGWMRSSLTPGMQTLICMGGSSVWKAPLNLLLLMAKDVCLSCGLATGTTDTIHVLAITRFLVWVGSTLQFDGICLRDSSFCEFDAITYRDLQQAQMIVRRYMPRSGGLSTHARSCQHVIAWLSS